MSETMGCLDQTGKSSDAPEGNIIVRIVKNLLVALGMGYECGAPVGACIPLTCTANNRRMRELTPLSALFL